MNYKIGDVVTNAAGIQTKLKKECFQCRTWTKEGHKAYKCCVKNSCPGWITPSLRGHTKPV